MVEEPRDQQPAPPTPAQPAPQPVYGQPAPAPAAPPAPPPYPGLASAQPSALDIGARVTRLMVGRAIWAGEQGWLLIAPRLGWVLLTAFLVGVIGVLSLLLALPRLVRTGPPSDGRVAAIPPAAAVEDFLRGQQTYDADLMWESFSSELRQDLEGRDFTRDTLAERVESERRAGQRYSAFKYIGGVELGGSQRMYFYVVDVASPQQKGTVSFVFTVGRDGKIMNIE
ncbi:MAG: hypothetical protein HGA45_17580 [Chloroflexales bacterium]|nr:hypothetical protein [Chloroflexales bacterium]